LTRLRVAKRADRLSRRRIYVRIQQVRYASLHVAESANAWGGLHVTGADSDGVVSSYLWNFGDGSTSNQQNPSYIYSDPGYYTASVTVTDNDGATATRSVNILVTGSSAFPYVINDFTFFPVPDIPRPGKGVTIQDPTFHTSITRITDAPTDVPGAKYNYAQPGYPKHDLENADGTMLIIQSFKHPGWHIWNAKPPFNYIKDIPESILYSIDPDVRWDQNDPNILYAHKGSKFYKWDVQTEEAKELHDFATDFPEVPVTTITMKEEGDSSADSRYWAFMVRNYDANHSPTWWNSHWVVYDKDYYGRDNGKIISVLEEGQMGCCSTDAISMSPSGNFVVLSDTLRTLPRDFSTIVDLPGCCSHFDFAYDDEGREVIVDVQTYHGVDGMHPSSLK